MRKPTIYFAILMTFATFGISCDEPESGKAEANLLTLLALNSIANSSARINSIAAPDDPFCNSENSVTASSSIQSVPIENKSGLRFSYVLTTVSIGDKVTISSSTTNIKDSSPVIFLQAPYDYCSDETVISGVSPFTEDRAGATSSSYTFTADYSGTFTLILYVDSLLPITDIKVIIE